MNDALWIIQAMMHYGSFKQGWVCSSFEYEFVPKISLPQTDHCAMRQHQEPPSLYPPGGCNWAWRGVRGTC